MNDHFYNKLENGIFQRLWRMQDCAPTHKLLAVRQRLVQVADNGVVALYHDVKWPPRSPHLTSCVLLLPNGGETSGWCILTLDIYLHV